MNIPTLSETVKRMKMEIKEDVKAGKVPANVKTFSRLHDYVDANEYGGFCEPELIEAMISYYGGRDENEGMPDDLIIFINNSQMEIHHWLNNNGLSDRKTITWTF